MSELADKFEQLRASVNAAIDQAIGAFRTAPPLPEDLVATAGASYSAEAGLTWPGWRRVEAGDQSQNMIAIRWDVNQWLQNMPARPGDVFEHSEHGRWKVGDDGTLIQQEWNSGA